MARPVDGMVPQLVLEEQSGDKRRVLLQARALPYRPLPFPGSQRNDITFAPGSAIGTLQALGPIEKPSTFNGAWKDRFIGQAPDPITAPGLDAVFNPSVGAAPAQAFGNGTPNGAVANVRDLVFLFEDIRRKGQLVKLTWGPITRFGLLQDFEPKWLTYNDVEWSMTFVWTSFDDDPGQTRVSTTTPDASDFVANAQSKLDATVQSIVRAVTTLPLDVGNAIATEVSTAQATINAGARAVEGALGGTTDAIAAARALAGMGSFLAATYGGTMDDVDAILDDRQLSQAEYVSRVNATRTARSQLRAARDSALEGAQLFLKKIDPDLLAVVAAREDQDLRELSTKYYGSPNHWRGLAVYNQLTSSRLSAGQIVLVPKEAT